MKLEEIQQLQPELVERFTQILEHKQLSHAYLFTGSFASFEMALLLAQSQFCEDLQGSMALWQMPLLPLDCRRRILRRKDRASSQPDH